MANAADCEYWLAERAFLPAELRPYVLYPQEAHHAARECVAKEPVEKWLGHAATLDPVLARVWERFKATMAPRAPAVEKETGGAKAAMVPTAKELPKIVLVWHPSGWKKPIFKENGEVHWELVKP